jgi:hypothetical protein
MIKEGNDHFMVTHLEPKVDVCDRHYVFDAQPPAGSTKPLVFSPSGHCPVYEVPQEIAGPAGEKERNDDYQIAQLIKDNAPIAPVTMGTDGGMNRVFVAKLESTQPLYDNDGHVHAPPIHPGMPPPTLSGPREDPQSGVLASEANSSRGLFGNLFDSKPSTQNPKSQVASGDTGTDDHSSFFGSLFKPKSTAAQQAPNAGAQGVALAGLPPAPHKSETAKAEPQIGAPQKPAPQSPTPQVAEAPKAKSPPDKSQQDANATPPPANNGGLMKGAQPVVPAGTFDGRWAGLQ